VYDNIFMKIYCGNFKKVFLQRDEDLALLYFFLENMLMTWYKVRLSSCNLWSCEV